MQWIVKYDEPRIIWICQYIKVTWEEKKVLKYCVLMSDSYKDYALLKKCFNTMYNRMFRHYNI